VLEGFDADFAAARQSHRPPHEVPEFAHVARPGEPFEARHQFARQTGPRSRRGIEPGEIFGQFANVAGAFAQRRQRNRNHVQAIKKIGAKAAFGDRGFERTVGGRDHADIDVHGLVRSQAVELALLQRAQQFRLQCERHLANFIEQQSAAVRRLKLARTRADRPGERAAGMAEQFAFEQGFGKRGAVQRDKRPRLAAAEAVNEARDQLFAGAAFGLDQNVGVGGGRLPRAFERLLPCRGVADQRFRVFAQTLRFLGAAQHLLDGQFEFLEADRLDQVIARPVAHGFDRIGHAAISGQQDHRRARRRSLHLAHQLEAVAAGHAHVGDDQRMRAGAKFLQRFGAVHGDIDQPSAALKAGFERGAHAGIVVGDQQPLHSGSPAAVPEGRSGRREVRRRRIVGRPVRRPARQRGRRAGRWRHNRDGSRRRSCPRAVRECAGRRQVRVRNCPAAC
jgi:hypothetical protein